VVLENRHVIEVVPTPLRALVAEIAMALGWRLETVRLCLARLMVTTLRGEHGLRAARAVATELRYVSETVPIPLLSSEGETA